MSIYARSVPVMVPSTGTTSRTVTTAEPVFMRSLLCVEFIMIRVFDL